MHRTIHFVLEALTALNWLVALAWTWRVSSAVRMLPRVPNLLDARYDCPSAPETEGPTLCVIVPARNEGEGIARTLRSLLAVENVDLEIIAVDDRSVDATGAIMDAIAAESIADGNASRLRVLHVRELPDGWMGKPHAMALAARQTGAPWLLFTDGDVIFREDSLCRAMALVREQPTDQLVVMPTLIVKTFGERMVLSYCQVMAGFVSRMWRIPDPKARRDYIGVGAFTMLRREAYISVGGYEALRMEVLEDMRMGFLIKRSGSQQRVAFGKDLVRIRWAKGALGVAENLSKNGFAVFRFRVLPLLGACAGLAALCILPFVCFFGGTSTRVGSAWMLLAAALLYSRYQRYSRISPAYVLGMPFAALLVIYAMLQSMVLTLRRDGVLWRGTLYPLRELRKRAGPLR